MTSPNPDEGITAGGCLEWHMKAGRCLLAAGALVLGIPVYLGQRRHMTQPEPVPPYR